MGEKEYQKFLETAPGDHFSDEFITFLINNNKVRAVRKSWLVIQNTKYWEDPNKISDKTGRTGNDWLTAFYIGPRRDDERWALMNLEDLVDIYTDYDFLIKAPSKRSVKLFHVHMYKK